jgi:hypothetical protein
MGQEMLLNLTHVGLKLFMKRVDVTTWRVDISTARGELPEESLPSGHQETKNHQNIPIVPKLRCI